MKNGPRSVRSLLDITKIMEQIPQQPKSQEKIEKEKEREKLYYQARNGIAALFETYKTEEERINAIKWQIGKVKEYLEDPEKISADLEACKNIEDKQEFIEAVFKAGKPIVDLKIDKPEAFERGEGDREFLKVNELLSYGVGLDFIHIHVVPEEKVGNVLAEFREGLEKLAELVNDNKTIKYIEATSWIVAKHPKILERFGFTIDGEISEAYRQEHFQGNDAQIHRAHINREDFLAKYLRK